MALRHPQLHARNDDDDLYLAPTNRRNFAKMFDTRKTKMIVQVRTVWSSNYDDMLSHFDRILERNGQTDTQNCYINIARRCADAR